jgi:hypothetical protein
LYPETVLLLTSPQVSGRLGSARFTALAHSEPCDVHGSPSEGFHVMRCRVGLRGQVVGSRPPTVALAGSGSMSETLEVVSMFRACSSSSLRGAMIVLVLAGLVSPLSACGFLEDRPSISDAVWLPNGDIYYQHVDFDGNSGMTRRDRSGNTSEVSLDGVDALLGSGCPEPGSPTLFVAPDGGLGLEYTCADGTRLLERTASGGFSDIGTLPNVWRNVTTTSGSTLTGIAMESVPSAYSSGTCLGIQAIRAGEMSKPFADVAWLGHTYHLSPPDSTACQVRSRLEGFGRRKSGGMAATSHF